MAKRKWLLIIPLILLVIIFVGPRPKTPEYSVQLPTVPSNPDSLIQYISANEKLHKLKPDNEARIVWANDSVHKKTPFSIVYLHGFSASQAEGEPVHRDIAKEFGCNLYLSRLAEHGIDTVDQLINLTVDKYWESAKRAYCIGKQLGDKVILVGTSTGASIALQLAANYPDVYALVLLSPNIAINDPNAWLLNDPWGLQIARMVLGSKYVVSNDNRDINKQYWDVRYRLEAVVQLEEMLETAMVPETFQKVHQPVQMLYYYKDHVHQDSVVKVDAMKRMFDELGTPIEKKKTLAMPNTGDHVIGSYIKSNDVKGVEQQISGFLISVVGLKPKF
jgi:esterase/lipase